MQDYKTYAGVDGCPAGWVAVYLTGDTWEVQVQERFIDLNFDCSLMLVDIPIGLQICDPRPCDLEAKKVLGKRKSSVFATPCQKAAYAENYTAANLVNRAYTGKGLSKQAWNICNKIREVNDFLIEHKELRPTVREVHPEVCLWALNQRQPMEHYKKTTEGFAERLDFLTRLYPQSSQVVEAIQKFTRSQVALDDVVDALCAAITAKLSNGHLMSLGCIYLTGLVPRDTNYLPMEMVYHVPDIILQGEDILALCARGQQWCHICPKRECGDNTNPELK